MSPNRIISTAIAIVVGFGIALVPGTSAPASAASNVTCNGGYTSSGPMGSFTYTFSANLNWASQNATHSVEMLMTYTGTNGSYFQVAHYANNSGIVSFTDSDTAPQLVDGVTISDETFVDGVSKGALFVHPSCRTYAEPPAPGQVVGLKASHFNRVITLTWQAPADNGGPITGYKVAGSRTLTTSTTKAVFTGLSRGTYNFTVTAVNAGGTGVASKIVTIKLAPPSRTTGLKARTRGKTITLSWRAPASPGSPITAYKISGTKAATTRQTTFVLRGLKRGAYKFQVAAVNLFGKGRASAVVRVRIR